MENNEAKQEAQRLIEWFLPRMYCYLGSGMLTNTYDYKVALMNAKQCAIKVCEEALKISFFQKKWQDIIKEIENYEQ